MKTMLAALLLGGAGLVSAPSVAAGELNTLFDLSFRLGDGGFTLGGRVDGPSGPASGAVSGRLQRGGLVIEGWVDERGQTWTFELDANVLDGALRAVVRRPPQRI
jgi:hypothetical protein